jgi:Bacterial membrane protein YfhO
VFNPTWLYVGALYAGAVWLARRRGIDIPVRVAAFFYALVLVFLYLPMTQDYVNLPVDFLKTLPPWSHLTRDHRAVNTDINDILFQIVPWAHQVRESWRAFEPPLWNHLSAAGYPLLASAQSSALSPLRILTLPLSLGNAMTAEAGMKILIALTFTFLYCRRRGYSELASVFGAVSFGFSTFIIVWLHFPLISTACFVPAVLYMIDLLAERRTYARFVCAALVWTFMLFGGHPETASHTFFLATLYALWLIVVERVVNWRFLLTLGAAMAVAALLAAPFLVPFAEAVTKSKRYQELKANPNRGGVPFSDARSAVVLFQPHFYGEVPHEKTWGPAHPESVSGFAGILGIAAWFALLAHVVRTRAWRSRELFFLLATLFFLGVILSWPGINEAFHLLFGLAANARLRLLFALLLSIQAAAAIDLLRRDARSVLIGISAAATLTLCVFYGSDFATAYHRDSAVLAIAPSLAVLAIATIAAVMKRREIAVLLLLTAVVAELWEIGAGWNPTVEKKWMYPRTPLLERMAEIQKELPKNEPFRVVSNGPMFFPNLSAIYGLEDVRAHDPMTNGRYIKLLETVVGYDSANYFAPWPDVYSHFLDYLNVRYFLATPHGQLEPSQWALRYEGPDGRIFENTTVLPRFYAVRNVVIEFNDEKFTRKLTEMDEKWWHTGLLEELELESRQMHDDFFNPRPADAPTASVEILQAHPRDYRMRVKSPRYSLIVSSVPWWPGWKVERNGARVDPIRVNGGFLGYAVPEGELDVRVWYDPWTFRFGVIAAVATIIGLIAFGLSGYRVAGLSGETRQPDNPTT